MSPSAQRRLRAAAGYAVGAACLVWVLHGIRPAELARDLAGLRWEWLIPAVALDILSYVLQGVRWRLLLATLGRLSTQETTEAIYAGLFASEVLPLRAGELVRAYLVARRLGKEMLSVFPSMAVERLFDGIWLAAAGEPKQWWLIPGRNHRFDGAREQFFAALREALDWVGRGGK